MTSKQTEEMKCVRKQSTVNQNSRRDFFFQFTALFPVNGHVYLFTANLCNVMPNHKQECHLWPPTMQACSADPVVTFPEIHIVVHSGEM